jgi:hypothetical protein
VSDETGRPEQSEPRRASEADGDSAPGADENRESRDALLSRLRVIEDQPLETRAEALGHVHDELRTRLEAGDAPRR